MRILIVGLNFYPELIGAGKYTTELALYLAGHGHEVHVITTPPYYPYWRVQAGYRAWAYQEQSWQGIHISRCPLWVPARPNGLTRLIHLASFAVSSLAALIKHVPWKPDLVFCIAPAIMSAPFALVLARMWRAKTWLHIQDFELDAAANLNMLPGRRVVMPAARALEASTLTRFDRVSTISENMRLLCVEKGLKQERVSLIPNWVDTREICPLSGPSAMRAELGVSSSSFVVLYHGNMGKKQGLEVLLESARLLASRPEFQFVLCGEGAARRELAERAESLPNVRFLELQPEGKLNDLANLADVHVLPQRADAADLVMPSKLSTMLASGKPVIAGACPGTQIYQVLDRIGIVIRPEDAGALAESLIRLYENPSERCRLGTLGRAYACQHLDKEVILGRLCDSLQLID